MSLPVPADYLIVPISQYPPNMPPFTPQLNVLPMAMQVLPMIASAVANEAGMKANTNNLRMFCYNLLVNNYWQNDSFVEVVKLTADMACLKIAEGQASHIEAAVQSATVEALVIFTSSLLFKFPELRSVVPQHLIDAASQNSGILSEIINKIHMLYNGQMPMYPVAGTGNQMGYQQPFQQQPFQQQQGYQPQGYGFPGPRGIPFNPNMGGGPVTRFDNTQGVSERISFSGGRQESNTNIKQDRFFTRDREFSKPTTEQNIIKETPVKETISKYVTTLGGSEMERSGNRINYFGDVFSTDTVIKDAGVKNAVDNLITANANDENCEVVSKTWMLEPSLDSAVFSGRIKHLDQLRKNKSIKAFRCFAIVCNPILSNDDLTEFVNIIRSAKDFISVANKIKSLTSAIVSKETNSDVDYISASMGMFSQVNDKLTIVLNDFLKYKIGTTIQIESFVEDVPMLYNYINNKYGLNYAQAYSLFEAELVSTLSQELVGDSMTHTKECLGISDGINVAILPIDISLTYLSINSKELGLNVQYEPLIVTKENTPTLYSIFESLKKHKRETEVNTICDFLVLSDGVRYKMYIDYNNKSKFTIVKRS